MAAAPAQLLPPAKRCKKDPECLETSRSFRPRRLQTGPRSRTTSSVASPTPSSPPTTSIGTWTCARSATDDPRDSPSDPRFLPRRWIILDEVVFESDTRRLLLNTATGRFLHKDLPALRDYYVVATTPRGFFVLADRSPPHAARVLNPLTGDIIRFTVPVPPEALVTAGVSIGFSPPMLALFCNSCCKMYMASPHSFDAPDIDPSLYSFFWRAVGGGLVGRWQELSRTADMALKISELGQSVSVDMGNYLFGYATKMGIANDDAMCFPMEFGGQMLVAIKGQDFFRVSRFQAESGMLLPVRSIGNHAFFIGHHRCLAVDADMFPSIEANCIYHTEHYGSSAHIRKYNINDWESERISEDVDFVKQDKQFVLVSNRPSTVIQLLSSYTISTRDSELAGAVKLDD